MIFEIKNRRIQELPSSWDPTELEIERYLFDPEDSSKNALRPEVFGEELLVISEQVRTRQKKRADLIAVDKSANGVVIEIKRHEGQLGDDTQALQYLAEFSAHKGIGFLNQITGDARKWKEQVLAFLEGEADIEKLNQFTRLILLARDFDESLFAMGEWLSSVGVAFRCIAYTPFVVSGRRFLSFSVAFDRSPRPLYRLIFPKPRQERGYYWHNIGEPSDAWWNYLKRARQIPASWQNKPGDKGERLLRSYVKGDVVFAYASGYGAIGWGEVSREDGYKLVPKGSPDDKLGWNRHRLDVAWRSVAPKLEKGVPAGIVERKLGIYHPVGTRAWIALEKAEQLQEMLNENFGLAQGVHVT
jgi:hypothetical protein